jgi:hypothetical protein
MATHAALPADNGIFWGVMLLTPLTNLDVPFGAGACTLNLSCYLVESAVQR